MDWLERGYPPVTIARDVSQPDGIVSRAAVSASEAIVYPPPGGDSPRHLMLVPRSGPATIIPGEGRVFASPRFSPDGRRIALGIADRDGSRDIWVLDVAQHTWSRLTTNGISNRPIWTPGWPSPGLLQQRRSLVDRRRRQRPAGEPARRQREPVRRDCDP
ncbi:MAG: hypothetical protein H0T50_02830 [Gemmatimonadales bacterium]|nr:hypothetical protein [Gemmatimonadales bacterium]